MIRPPDASYFSIIQFRDAEGRPLGEGAEANRRAGAPMALATCRYPGSRFEHAHPMNLSALQQVRRHWQGCRGLLAWARHTQLRQLGAGRASLSDLWRRARVAQAVPGWLLLRHAAPVPDGNLPPAVAAAFKVVIGIAYAAQDLHLRRVLDGRDDETAPTTAAELLDHAEQQNLLIGPTQVCAGPAGMIREMIALLIDGDDAALSEPAVATLVGDGTGAVGYASQAIGFYAAGTVMQLFVHALTAAAARLVDRFAAPSTRFRTATETLLAALPKPSPLRAAGELPADRLAVIAESIARFMTGESRGDGLASLIAAWRRPRPAAEVKLSAFLAAAGAPMPSVAAAVPLLATQLAMEQAWLRLNRDGEAGLLGALGRTPPTRAMPELDGLLGKTVLRDWLEAALGLEFAQREDGAALRCGGAQLLVPAALL